MRPKTNRLVKAVVLTILITVLLCGRCWGRDSYNYYARKLPDPGVPYDFTLMGPEGEPFSLSSLRGKFVLLSFGFTHCPNICPTTLANLAAAYELLSPGEQRRVQVLFVTLDPERDTAEVLKNYVTFFDKHFIGLSGRPEQIAATAAAYTVEYEKRTEWGAGVSNYSMNHSAAVLLLAPSGQWFAYYQDTQLAKKQRVADDLRHFLSMPVLGPDNWQSERRGVVRTPQLSGRQLYLEQCASCHGENGRGVSGKYRSLAGSNWVTGAPNRLTTLVLEGVREGKDGAPTGPVMPAWRAVLTSADIAALLTYTRQAWGNDAPAISASYVQKLGYQFASRPGFWSWKELEAVAPDEVSDASSF
jgi:protein SCO1/2